MRYVKFKPKPVDVSNIISIQQELGRDLNPVERIFIQEYRMYEGQIYVQNNYFAQFYPDIESVPDMIPLRREKEYYGDNRQKYVLKEIPKFLVELEQVDEQVTTNGLRMIS